MRGAGGRGAKLPDRAGAWRWRRCTAIRCAWPRICRWSTTSPAAAIEIGLGQGYRPAEFDQFGWNYATRTRAFEELLDILEKAWTGEPFDYAGKIYSVKGGRLRRHR